MTHDDSLVRMANQIGAFFESMPDRAEALAGIAKHIKKFWDPRMRKAFLAYVDGTPHEDIKPIVLAAVLEHRALIETVTR
ncbi:formate dehydrogenase subunit delta [Verminephrobacter eiseniae]|uniref:Formate dehydrogenase delta subunit n=1 Tax=Verminephrobacter eiseniae (strain EF01-2) TaxID=391735 RepID=A1WKH0_VEREI|nr:formate dehydrogenase subunit delta [Verminephrobacter eiseniae]KAB7623064.1 formate dehydrogenase subunit delta [Verminephrobacter sp. Larva24]ABM58127.1 formate dehydrogenase delta subunit [Verminephrobacter eiseniae EF01-2]MCW5232491.1 formate dehydrogenase [Verminephrobacter eiseniae]MCW5237073.1 formate dehydrogenase [Verminephrobacter eiseniae]MCW5263204.1 formate dehydrogenase [Verminephrobacter eiseniae]